MPHKPSGGKKGGHSSYSFRNPPASKILDKKVSNKSSNKMNMGKIKKKY